jgi:hypothetical protein
MRALLLLLPPLLLAAGCSKGGRACGDHCGCFSIEDCPSDNICFLGTCQSPGYNISTVYIDLLPASASGLPAQPDAANPRQLSTGLNFDIGLRRACGLTGHVQAASGREMSGLLVAQVHGANTAESIGLPSTMAPHQAVVDAGMGFSLQVVPGSYDLTFQPPKGSTALPPLPVAVQTVADDQEISIEYPDTSLVSMRGTVSGRSDTVSPVMGALINAIGLTDSGGRLVSTTATTNDAGEYTVVMPPGARTVNLTLRQGSPTGGNPLVPTITFNGLTPQGTPLSLGTQVLEIPLETVSLTTHVTNAGGGAASDVAVLFDGAVGESATQGTFHVAGSTDPNGQFATTLVPGTYTVTLVPGAGQNAASVSSSLCVQPPGGAAPACTLSVTQHGTLSFTLPTQVTVTGKVTSHAGQTVANARVAYTARANSPTQRVFATTSDAEGHYAVQVDPASSSEGLEYDVSVEPEPSSGLPRYRSLFRLGPADVTHDVQLWAPSFVYGHVLDPSGAPVEDVTIALYSVDLGSAKTPLLVGLGKSTTGGEFVIPLPTATAP